MKKWQPLGAKSGLLQYGFTHHRQACATLDELDILKGAVYIRVVYTGDLHIMMCVLSTP